MAIKTEELEFITEIIREIISNRANLTPGGIRNHDEIIKNASLQLRNGLPISIRILVGLRSTDCGDPSQELEIWTFNFRLPDATAKADSGTLPFFLKHAIKSQLHFSPLTSWFSQFSEENRRQMEICIKVSTDLNSNHVQRPEDVQHTFPSIYILDDGSSQFYNGRRELFINLRSLARENIAHIFHIESDATKRGSREASPISIAQKPEKKEKIRTARKLKSNSESEPLVNNSLMREYRNACTSTQPLRFNPRTRLPLNSSPVPPLLSQRRTMNDKNQKNYELSGHSKTSLECGETTVQKAARLLCNFEESALNGCIQPASSVNGFTLQLVAGLPSEHITLPVRTYYYNSNDSSGETPSLHMGYCNLTSLLKVPKRCTIQAILFNPQGSVIKIFLVDVDVNDIPSNSRTFIRQRTFSGGDVSTCTSRENNLQEILNDKATEDLSPNKLKSRTLRFLIHFRIVSDAQKTAYLHSDIRMLFSNKANLFEEDQLFEECQSA